MNNAKRILIEGKTAPGDSWRIEADMEGAGLGIIYLWFLDPSGPVSIACDVADVDRLVGALGHTATSIDWIKQHGLDPTFQAPSAEPQS